MMINTLVILQMLSNPPIHERGSKIKTSVRKFLGLFKNTSFFAQTNVKIFQCVSYFNATNLTENVDLKIIYWAEEDQTFSIVHKILRIQRI